MARESESGVSSRPKSDEHHLSYRLRKGNPLCGILKL
jgi:hypothetical protein